MKLDILNFMPWAKITAPMVPVVGIDMFFGYMLLDLYKFNALNNITDKFPTDKTFSVFLWANLLIISVYLILSVLGQLSEEKINQLSTLIYFVILLQLWP